MYELSKKRKNKLRNKRAIYKNEWREEWNKEQASMRRNCLQIEEVICKE